MVAIVSGNGLGLLNSSAGVLGQQGVFGNASLGMSKEATYVNVANGNLVLQDTDDFLAARGFDIALTRTYNSSGSFADGNGGWKVGASKQVTGLTGTLNTAGSTVTRIDSDGSASLYTYDTTLGVYRSTNGGGGYDSLSMNSHSEWVWTSDRQDLQGTVEIYDSTQNAGHITATRDQTGLVTSYQYNAAGQLSQIADASGNQVSYVYTGANLTQIHTIPADTGLQSTAVYYAYDTSNRLTSVTLDLTPGDNKTTDAATYTTTYTYRSTSNQIATITQADGTKLTFGYTQVPATTGPWLLTTVTDGLSQVTTYSYAVAGATTVTDPLGYKTTYTYDAQGQLTDVTTPAVNGASQHTHFEYDANGNLTKAVDARGLGAVYQYDTNGNRIFERDTAGNTITRTYDLHTNKLLTETRYLVADPDGDGAQAAGQPLTTNYVYDTSNRLRFVVSPEGRVVEYRYNTLGQRITALQYTALSAVALAANATAQSQATLDAMSAWTTSAAVTSSLTNRTDYGYDVHGRVLSSSTYQSPGGSQQAAGAVATATYIYDQHGWLLKSVDGNGNIITYTYDGLGRPVSSTDALGNITSIAYTASSNSIKVTQANGLITNTTYDKDGNVTSVVKTDAAAHALGTTSYLYNGDSLPWKATDPAGLVSYVIYDAAGRKVANIDASGAMTEYRYNLDNQVSRVIQYATPITAAITATTTLASLLTAAVTGNTANRNSWNLYDNAGRLSESVDGDGDLVHYDYDGASQLTQVVQRATPLTAAQLTALASVDVPTAFPSAANSADRISRTLHDGDGRVVGQLDADGNLTEYRYDGAGHLVEAIAYATAAPAAARAAGNLGALRPAVAAADIHQRYFYNAQGKVIAAIDGQGYLTETGYDNDGNVTSVRRYATAVTHPGAASFADIGKSASAADQLMVNTWSAGNRLLTQVGTDGVTTRYIYDKAGNVTEVRRALSTTDERVTQMRYDLLGNLTAQLTPAGVALLSGATTQAQIDAIWAANAVQYAYNADGMRISMTDPNGKKTLFYYDGDGRLAYTIAPTGAVVSRTYDTFGGVLKLRTSTTLVPATTLSAMTGGMSASVASTITATQTASDPIEAFVYDRAGRLTDDVNPLGGHTLYTYDAFGNVVQKVQADASQHPLGTTSNVYDGDGRLLRSTLNGATTYYVYDAFGRVVGAVDADGALTEYVYNADGQLTHTVQYATLVNPTPMDSQGNPLPLTLAQLRPTAVAADRATWQSYDATGRLTDSIDAAGYLTHYDYDAAGRPARVTRYAQPVDLGQLANATSAAGIAAPAASVDDRSVRTLYNAAGDVVARVDADGYLTRYLYNSAGQQIETIAYAVATPTAARAAGDLNALLPAASSDDIHQHFLYNVAGQQIARVDGDGYLTELAYDAAGNLVKQTRHANAVGNPAAATVALMGLIVDSTNDQLTSYTYSPMHQVLTQTGPDGTVTRYTYDMMGNLTETRSALGTIDELATQTRYDALGRVVAVLTAQGVAAIGGSTTQSVIDSAWASYSVKYTYNAAGRRASVTDQDGNKTLLYYDPDGNLRYSVDAAGEVSDYRYSAFKQLVSTTRINGRLSADILSALTGTETLDTLQADITAMKAAAPASDSAIAISYDALGRVISQTDALGNQKRSSYDAFGDLLNIVDQTSGIATSYRYDHRGDLLSTTPHNNPSLATSTSYDAFGRAVSHTDGNGNTGSVAYNRRGLAISVTNAASATTHASYDALGRVLTQTDALGNVTSYSYNTAARSYTITTPEGLTLSTSLNREGQTISIVDGSGGTAQNTTSYTYDKNGNLISVTDSTGKLVTDSYDNAGLLLTGTDADGIVTAYTYDAAERVLTRTVDTAGLKLVTSYNYDALGRVLSVTDPNGSVTATSYDADGNVTAVVADAGAGRLNLTTRFTYDSLARKLSVTDPSGIVTQYSYDANGFASSSVVDAGGVNQRTDVIYDDTGKNVLLRSTDQQQSTRYAYDKNNNLIWTVDPSGATTGYTYNADNELIKTTHYANPSSLFAGGRPAWNQTFSADQIAAGVTPDTVRDAVTRTFYDRDGRVYAAVDAMGNVTVYLNYNALNKAGEVISYFKRVATTDSTTTAALQTALAQSTQASTSDRTQMFVYDARGRITASATATGLDASNTQNWAVVRFSYDGNGNLTSRVAYAATMAGNAPTASTITSWLSSAITTEPSSVVDMFYDGANRLLATVVPKGADASYSYWQLSTVSYDKDGNVVLQTSYAANMKLGVGATPTAANIATWVSGAAVNQADRRSAMVYDGANRLVATATALTYAQTATDVSTWTVSTQAYDADGNVIERHSYATGLQLTGLNKTPAAADIAAFTAVAVNTSSADHRTYLAYDHADRVTSIATAMAVVGGDLQWAIATRQYDVLGNLIRQTQYANTVGNSAVAVPGAAALAAKVVINAAADRSTRYTYDLDNRQTVAVDAMGAVIRQVYDALGNVIERIAYAAANADPAAAPGPLDRVSRTVYDLDNRPVFDIDAAGDVTERRYDTLGNLSAVVEYASPLSAGNLQALGAAPSAAQIRGLLPVDAQHDRSTRYVYDSAGNVRFIVDAAGYITEKRYDGLGRLLTLLAYPVAVSLTDAGIAAGVAAQSTAQASTARKTSYAYDGNGNLLSVTDANGGLQSYTYDALGNKISCTDQLGAVWNYAYDALGHMVTQTSPQVAAYTNALGTTMGTWGNGTLQSDITQYVYDVFGHVSKMTEVAGTTMERATTYAYDNAGRLVKTSQPSIKVYDAASDPLSSAGGVGAIEKDSGVRSVSTTYDTFGDAIASTDVGGATTYSLFDQDGRVTAQIDALGYVTGYQRNAFGETEALTRYATGVGLLKAPLTALQLAQRLFHDASQDRTILTSYDLLGRIVLTREPAVGLYDQNSLGQSALVYAGRTTATRYNAFGQIIETSVYGADAKGNMVSQAAVTRYYFDLNGNTSATIEALSATAGAQSGYLTSYTYDLAGNVLSKKEYSNAITAWNDATYQTPVADTKLDRETDYTYDKLNHVTAEIKHNVAYTDNTSAGASVTGDVSTTYAYNLRGDQTTATDALKGTTYTYYDNLRRVTGVATTQSVAVSGITTATARLTQYKRDIQGNIVLSIEYAQGATSATATSATPASTTDVNNRVTATAYDLDGNAIQVLDPEQYAKTSQRGISYISRDVYGRAAKQWQTVNNGSVSQTTYQVQKYDALGQLILVSTPNDRNGSATQRDQVSYEYNAFGELTGSGQGDIYNSYSYDQAGNRWRSSENGVDQVSLYNVAGQATVVVTSTSTSDLHALQALTSASQALLLSDVQRTDTRYDLLGHTISIDTGSNNNHAQILQQSSDGWSKTTSAIDQTTAGSLLIIGRPEDSNKTFTLRYRLLSSSAWIDAPASAISWVDGYPTFNTAGLAGGDYAYQVLAKPAGEPVYQSASGTLSILGRDAMLAEAKQIISLYLMITNQIPTQTQINAILQDLSNGGTLAQLAASLFSSSSSLLNSTLIAIVGLAKGEDVEQDAAWDQQLDLDNPGAWQNGEVLLNMLYANQDALERRGVSAVLNYLVIQGGSNMETAAQLTVDAADSPDGAIAESTAAATSERQQDQLIGLYVALFGGMPSRSDAASWSAALQTGSATLQDIAQGLIDTLNTAATTDTVQARHDLVVRLYSHLFSRAPTDQEISSSLAQLSGPPAMTSGAFVVSLLQKIQNYVGAENDLADARTRLYDKVKLGATYLILNTGASDADIVNIGSTYIDGVVQSATLQASAGNTLWNLYARMVNSQRTLNDFGDVDKIAVTERQRLQLARLYVVILGRAPEQAEFLAGMTLLKSTGGYAQLAAQLMSQAANGTRYPAAMADGDFAAQLYQNLYGQAADAATLAGWATIVQQNGRATAATQMIAALQADRGTQTSAARALLQNQASVAVTYAQCISYTDTQVGTDIIAKVSSDDLTAAIEYGQSQRQAFDSVKQLVDPLNNMSEGFQEIVYFSLPDLDPLAQAAVLYTVVLGRVAVAGTSAAEINSLATVITNSGINAAVQQLLDSTEGKARYGAELTDGTGLALAKHLYSDVMAQSPPTAPGALDYWANYLKTDVTDAFIAIMDGGMATVPAPATDITARGLSFNAGLKIRYEVAYDNLQLEFPQFNTPDTPAYNAGQQLTGMINSLQLLSSGDSDAAQVLLNHPGAARLLSVIQAMLILPGVTVSEATIVAAVQRVNNGESLTSVVSSLLMNTPGFNPTGATDINVALAAMPRTFAAALYANLHSGTAKAAAVDAFWAQLKSATDIGSLLVQLSNPSFGASTPAGLAAAQSSAAYVFQRLTQKLVTLWPSLSDNIASQAGIDGQLPAPSDDIRLMDYALHLALTGTLDGMTGLFTSDTMDFEADLISNVSSLLGTTQVRQHLGSDHNAVDFVKQIYAAFNWPASEDDIAQQAKLLDGGMSRGDFTIEVVSTILNYSGSNLACQAQRLVLLEQFHDAMVVDKAELALIPGPAEQATNAADGINNQDLNGADLHLIDANSSELTATFNDSPQPSMTVDRWGNVLSVTDPRDPNWKISYSYNYRNELIDQTANTLAGATPQFHTQQKYDALGRVVANIDANGNINRQSYDSHGNVVTETHADGGMVTSTYSLFGQRLSVTQPATALAGVKRNYVYDHLGNLLKTSTDASVAVYTVNGSMVAGNSGARQLAESYTYDELGRRISTTDAAGTTTRQVYDLDGNVIQSIDGLGKVTVRQYDQQHHLLYQRDANGNEQWWEYSSDDRLSSSRDMSYQITAYNYNAAGQLVQQTSTRGQDIRYTYDGNNLIGIEDVGTGLNTSYTYDAANNRLSEQQSYAGWVVIRPDQVQNNRLTYDMQNRLVGIQDDQYKLTYTYDNNGNRIQTHTQFDSSAFDAYNTYDGMNRELIINGDLVGGKVVYGQHGHQIVYDKAGNRVSDTYLGTKITGSAGAYAVAKGVATTESYAYDAVGRLSTVKRDNVLVDTIYYDADGRTVESGFVTASSDVTLANAAAAVGMAPASQTYTYDADGHATRQLTRTLAGLAQSDINYVMADGSSGYDNVGNMLGYTVNNLLGGSTDVYTFQYDVSNIYEEKYVTLNNDSTTTDIYDANNHRTNVNKDNLQTGASSSTRYWYDADGNIQSRTEDGKSTFALVVEGNVLGNETKELDNFIGQNYSSATSTAYSAAPSVYTCQANDTLQIVAQRIWGDSSLWYLIGDLNGIESGAALPVGRVLKIPPRVNTVHNNFKTVAAFTDGADSTPLASPSNANSCGAMGGIVSTTIAIAASYITSGKWNDKAFSYLTQQLGSAQAASDAMAMANQVAKEVVDPLLKLSTTGATSIANDFLQSVLNNDGSAATVAQAFSRYGSSSGTNPTTIRNALTKAANSGAGIMTGLRTAFDWNAITHGQIAKTAATAVDRTAQIQAAQQKVSDEAAAAAASYQNTLTTAIESGAAVSATMMRTAQIRPRMFAAMVANTSSTFIPDDGRIYGAQGVGSEGENPQDSVEGMEGFDYGGPSRSPSRGSHGDSSIEPVDSSKSSVDISDILDQIGLSAGASGAGADGSSSGSGSAGSDGSGATGNDGSTGNDGTGSTGNDGTGSTGNDGTGSTGNDGTGSSGNNGLGSTSGNGATGNDGSNSGAGSAANDGSGSTAGTGATDGDGATAGTASNGGAAASAGNGATSTTAATGTTGGGNTSVQTTSGSSSSASSAGADVVPLPLGTDPFSVFVPLPAEATLQYFNITSVATDASGSNLSVTKPGDTLSSVFQANYGRQPTLTESVQYANVNNLSNANDVSVNREISSPDLDTLHNTAYSQDQMSVATSADAQYHTVAQQSQQGLAGGDPSTLDGLKAGATQQASYADQLSKAAQSAYAQGDTKNGTAYQNAANTAYYTSANYSQKVADLTPPSQSSNNASTSDYSVSSQWSYMGANSSGLPPSNAGPSGTMSLGINGSYNAGYGVAGQAGMFLNPGINGSTFGFGIFVSGGNSYGFDPGVSASAGYVKGDVTENFSGSATNVNVGFNPIPDVGGQYTTVMNNKNEVIGGSISVGIRGTPSLVGPAVSVSQPTTYVMGWVNGQFTGKPVK